MGAYNLPGGYSSPAGKEWLCARLAGLRPASVLDVGAGAGTYAHLVRRLLPRARLAAVEVWEPYTRAYRLGELYHEVLTADARHVPLPAADVVILGEVLDRMPTADAAALWAAARRAARVAVLASVTVAGHPATGHPEAAGGGGNPFERRAADWTPELAAELLAGVVDRALDGEVGVYLAAASGPAGASPARSLGGVAR